MANAGNYIEKARLSQLENAKTTPTEPPLDVRIRERVWIPS